MSVLHKKQPIKRLKEEHKKKIALVTFLLLILTFSFLTFATPADNNESEPVIASASVDPIKVVPGDVMLVQAEVKDNFGIISVIANMGGIETIELDLANGSIYQGVWKKKWRVHDTEIKEYITTITATNKLGQSATREVIWSDPASTNIHTDRKVYLLDPWLWVDEASQSSGCGGPCWDANGHPVDVTLSAMLINERGLLIGGATPSYEVYNPSVLIASGTLSETSSGFYTTTIEVNEATGTGNYTANVTYGPETYTTYFKVDRWGCDECHRKVTGGHAAWSWMMGASCTNPDVFMDYTYLQSAEKTHTPTSSYCTMSHEEYAGYWGCTGIYACHRESSTRVVNCTLCHTGYLMGEHSNVEPATSGGSTTS